MIFILKKKFLSVVGQMCRLIALFFLFGLIFLGSLNIATPVQSLALDTNSNSGLLAQDSGILGFGDCMVDETNPQRGQGSQVITKCFSSISRFIFISGIIVAGYKFAVNTIGSYIPGQSIDAVKQGKEAIWGFIVGAILIGAPGAILSLFNSGSLRLDFLTGLTSLGQTNKTGSLSTNDNTNTTSSTSTSISTGTSTGTSTSTTANNNANPTVTAQNEFTITAITKVSPIEFATSSADSDKCQDIFFQGQPKQSTSGQQPQLFKSRFCVDSKSQYYYKRLGNYLQITLENTTNNKQTFKISTGQLINIVNFDSVN